MRSILIPAALFFLAGCDSDDPIDPFDPGDFTFTCEQVGLTSDGSMTASTSSGAFAGNCFEVNSFNGRLDITGFDLDLTSGEFNAVIRLETDDAAPGTYPIVEDEDDPEELYGGAAFGPSGTNTLDASSGSVTITESSANRIAGSFSFVTSNGSAVSDGRFSINF